MTTTQARCALRPLIFSDRGDDDPVYGSDKRARDLSRVALLTVGQVDPNVFNCFICLIRVFDLYMNLTDSADVDALARALRSSQTLFEKLGLEGLLEYWKWKTTAFFAFLSDQDLPKRPESCSTESALGLIGGKFYSFSRRQALVLQACRVGHSNCCQRSCRLARSFATSILMLKKGLPRPSKRMLKLAEFNYGKALTVERQSRSDKEGRTIDQLCDQVRRTVREVFSGVEKVDKSSFFPVPSLRATFQSGIKDGGGFGHIVRYNSHCNISDGVDGSRAIRGQEKIIRMKEFMSNGQMPLPVDGQPSPTLYVWEEECIQKEWWDFRLLDEWCRRRWDCVTASFDLSESRVKPVALAEPLKIRTISKGPAELYWFLKPVQQLVWKIVKSHPAFSLIGSPCDEDILSQTFCKGLPEGCKWVSADYKSATDLLDPMLSVAAVDEICVILDFDDRTRDAFIRSLVGHEIAVGRDWREKTNEKGELEIRFDYDMVPQKWGQLMGSPTSFPILCLVNAALTRHSLELGDGYRRNRMLTEMLFNGDDALFYCDASTYEIWKEVTQAGGLVPSVGKNYFSNDFAVINSTYYYYNKDGSKYFWDRSGTLDETTVPRMFAEVPFVNMGLLSGLKRSGGVSRLKSDDLEPLFGFGRSLGDCAKEFEKGFSGQFLLRLRRLFRDEHLKRLKTFPGSWYLPKMFGGLGLPCDSWELSELDVKLAVFIVRNQLSMFLFQGAPSDYPLHEEAMASFKQWGVSHNYVVCGRDELVGQVPDSISGIVACRGIMDGGFSAGKVWEEGVMERKLKSLKFITDKVAKYKSSYCGHWTASKVLDCVAVKSVVAQMVRQPMNYTSFGMGSKNRAEPLYDLQW